MSMDAGMIANSINNSMHRYELDREHHNHFNRHLLPDHILVRQTSQDSPDISDSENELDLVPLGVTREASSGRSIGSGSGKQSKVI
jgi:hypothetical protein